MRKISPEAIFCFLAYLSSFRHSFPKEGLLGSGLAPATVNAKLSALNGLFRFLGWEDCRVRFLKLQFLYCLSAFSAQSPILFRSRRVGKIPGIRTCIHNRQSA